VIQRLVDTVLDIVKEAGTAAEVQQVDKEWVSEKLSEVDMRDNLL